MFAVERGGELLCGKLLLTDPTVASLGFKEVSPQKFLGKHC